MSHLVLFIAQIANRGLFPGILLAIVFLPGDGIAAQFIEIKVAATSYRVELARSAEERRRGLMMRPGLERSSGMLLVYRQAGDHRIWMKNMLIPLRVYWIDSDSRVIGSRRLEPCPQDPCPIYSISQPSLYVLELSDHEHDIKLGDRINGLSDL